MGANRSELLKQLISLPFCFKGAIGVDIDLCHAS